MPILSSHKCVICQCWGITHFLCSVAGEFSILHFTHCLGSSDSRLLNCIVRFILIWFGVHFQFLYSTISRNCGGTFYKIAMVMDMNKP